MPSRPLVECGVAAHDRYGRGSNPGGPEARGPSRGLPTCCLYKDLPAKSSQLRASQKFRRATIYDASARDSPDTLWSVIVTVHI